MQVQVQVRHLAVIVVAQQKTDARRVASERHAYAGASLLHLSAHTKACAPPQARLESGHGKGMGGNLGRRKGPG